MAVADTSLIFHMIGRDGVTPVMRKTTAEVFKIDNAIRSSARRMAGRVVLIGAAFASVAGHAVALTGSIWPLVGALGAIPAISAAGVAGLAALIAGFSGLGAAMKGGEGGDDAYAKLSTSARSLVDTLRAIGPQWREVQQATQETLFSGVAGDIKMLSTAYLPVMKAQLPAIAQGWNNMFRSISATASSAGFVSDMNVSLGNTAVMWQRVGRSFGSFFSGFRHWTVVGSTFLPRLGSWVERLAMRFDLWSLRMRQSGKAFAWIENALVTGHKLNELIKSWSRSLFEVFRLGQDRTLLDRLIEGSQVFERWLKTAEGQDRITNMWERAREVGTQLWRVVKEVLGVLSQFDLSPLAVVLGAVADALGFVNRNMGWLNQLIGPLILTMVALKVATIASDLALKTFNTTLAMTGVTSGKANKAVGLFSKGLGVVTLLLLALQFTQEGVKTGSLLLEESTDDLTDATNVQAQAWRNAKFDLQAYSDQLRAGTDPAFGVMQAQENVAAAQARVNEAAAVYGEGSPQHIQAVRDLQQATIDLNGAAVAAAEVDETLLLPQLREMERQGLLAAGSSQAIADALANARQRAKELDGTQARIKIFQVVETIHGPGVRMGGGSFLVMHGGGTVPGRRGEEVAAVLQAGERVTPLNEVDKPAASGGNNIRVWFDIPPGSDHNLERALVHRLRKYIRASAGGNVQAALGG